MFDDKSREDRRRDGRDLASDALKDGGAKTRRENLADILGRIEHAVAGETGGDRSALLADLDRLRREIARRDEAVRDFEQMRDYLVRVSAERDRLRMELTRVSSMQTETIALTEEERERNRAPELLPTLEDLMSGWNDLDETPRDRVEDCSDDQDWSEVPRHELISPEAVFRAEDFADEAADRDPSLPRGDGAERNFGIARAYSPAPDSDVSCGNGHDAFLTGRRPFAPKQNSKVLVYLDSDPPIRYPLYRKVTTIGRAETADIRVTSDFISRIHARIIDMDGSVLVEDAGSKNGIEVNSRPVLRYALRHGDVLSLGTFHFTFVDLAADS
jgi:hypothetical protein